MFYGMSITSRSYLLLFSGMLIIAFLNKTNNNSAFVQYVEGHNFVLDSFASFIAAIDQFQIESDLVKSDIINGNYSLAQKHSDEALTIFSWDLMGKIAIRNKTIADELNSDVQNLQDISSSLSTNSNNTINSVESKSESIFIKEQEGKVSDLVTHIHTNTEKIANKAIKQKESENFNPFNQLKFFYNIFTGGKGSNINSEQPMRVVEILDSILRNYGDAFDVKFDMTDMSNMVMQDNYYPTTNLQDIPFTTSNTNMDSITVDTIRSVMNNSLVNTADYQNAKWMSEKLLEIFEENLKPIASKEMNTDITNLENGLIHLNKSIENRFSPMYIMSIVHSQIHPNLIKIFDIPSLSNA